MAAIAGDEKFALHATLPPAPAAERGEPSKIDVHGARNKVLYVSGMNVYVRDLLNPEIVEVYTEHKARPTVARMSTNGHYIASADEHGYVRSWGYCEGYPLKKETPAFAGKVLDLAWGDNRIIAAVGDGRASQAKVFQYDAGNNLGTLAGHDKAVTAVAFKKTRPFRIATTSLDMRTAFYCGLPFKFERTHAGHSNFVNDVAYAPDGSIYITVGSDKRAIIHEGKTGEALEEMVDIHTGSCYGIAFSPDSTQFATASADKTVKLWDVETRAEIQSWTMGDTFHYHQTAIAWGGDHLVSLSLNGDLNLLVPGADAPRGVLEGHQVTVTGVSVDRDTTAIYSGSYDGRVCGWHGESYAVRSARALGDGHTSKCTGVAVAGGQVYSTGFDDMVRVAPVSADDTTYAAAVALGAQPVGIGASTAADVCAVATLSNVTLLRAGALASVLPVDFVPSAVAVDASGSEVAVGDKDGKSVHLFTVEGDELSEAKEPLTELPGPPSAISYSDDGVLLAVADSKPDIRVYNRETGECVIRARWRHHTSRINALAFSPCGKFVASGSIDNHVFVYSVESPMKRIKIMFAHRDGVNSLSWADGNTLVSGGVDGVVRTWKVDLGAGLE
eukprot:PLAT4797.1.p1 GENE.PLAT4797.1~~PLAT4797.1.p1  ORF type:complete len:641 (-),score=303.53 PLAT4797.1:127-1971(-)